MTSLRWYLNKVSSIGKIIRILDLAILVTIKTHQINLQLWSLLAFAVLKFNVQAIFNSNFHLKRKIKFLVVHLFHQAIYWYATRT